MYSLAWMMGEGSNRMEPNLFNSVCYLVQVNFALEAGGVTPRVG